MKSELLKYKKHITAMLLLHCFFLNAEKVFGLDSLLIFPVPQQLQVTRASFIIDESTVLAVSMDDGNKSRSLANLVARELSDRYGFALPVAAMRHIPKGKKTIIVGTLKSSLVEKYCIASGIKFIRNEPGPEGYFLHVSDSLIVVGGYDDAGVFYGIQSLRQLLQKGKGKVIQGVKVVDWPAFPFRAIRLYVPGPDNIAFFKRFISNFMALYKYNKVIIEFNCMRLDRHPEVNTGWLEFVKYMEYTRSNSTEGIRGEEKNSSHYDAGDGFIIEKDMVREIVDYAKDNFLEVIPEIPSLTHAYYLLARHPELAEYPGDTWPDTYCPSNPESYKLMFDVYDEYLEVIKPNTVHIGHDEWWGAPIDVCPKCRGKNYSELFAGDVRKVHRYFSEKNIKVAMWGDYLLESVREKGTQKRISSTGVKYETPGALSPSIVTDLIPKDILIFNWFWKDQAKERELNDLGFTQVYGNFTPNISDWDERIKRINLSGGAPSSWASTSEFNFGKDLMLDFLGCANLLWSHHTIHPLRLQRIVWELVPSIRSYLSSKRVPSEDENTVEPIDISHHYNLARDANVFNIDLRNMNAGAIHAGSKTFNLFSPKPTGECVIAVCSKGKGACPLPNKVEGIAIKEDVSSIIFLHASARAAGNQKAYFNIPNNFDSPDLLGWYEIIYDDGFKEIIPLQYGVNIMEWNPGGEKSLDTLEGETGAPQSSYCYEADPINFSAYTSGPTFYAYEWVNKRSGKPIREINLFGSNNFLALKQNYGRVETEPMMSNAVILAGISIVKSRQPLKPHN